MAAADIVSLLSHQQMFKQDAEMDNFFDFNQLAPTPQPQQSSRPPATSVIANSATAPTDPFALDDFSETQIFAGPSHQYDLFRQQTGVSLGDLSHLQPPNNASDPLFTNTALDAAASSWPYDDSLMDFGAPGPSTGRDLSLISEMVEDEQPSNVGRLWPGMHQQQAQQAAQAKAQALALRHAHASQVDSISPLAPAPKLRQPSIAPSLVDDDGSFLPSSARSKKDEEDLDEDERLLASEEGKKLTSKERRQLRNKVSARAFRSRRKEYITHLEGEINGKAQEIDQLKSDKAELTNENARYRNLIQFLIRQPAMAPVLQELGKDPAMVNLHGLNSHLLSPAGSSQPVQQRQHVYNPNSAGSVDTPLDPSGVFNMPGGNSFTFQ